MIKMSKLIKKQQNEGKKSLNEMDLDKIKLPSNIERFSDRLIKQIQRVNLTRPRQYALVGRIIAAVGIDINKLTQMMSVIKRDLRSRD